MNSFNNSHKPINPAKNLQDVINYGLWHLGRREHGVNELRVKLGRKTDNSEWIEETLIKLQEWGYLNEQRFIENFLRNCNEFKQYGPSKIKQELKMKGVDISLIKSAMEDSEFDYFDSVLQYLNKRYKNPIEDRKEKDKITRHLLSKGFGFDMIRYAFEEHLKNPDGEE